MIVDPEDQPILDAKRRLKAAQNETRKRRREMKRAIDAFAKATQAERLAGIELFVAFGLRGNRTATRKSVLQYLLEQEKRR